VFCRFADPLCLAVINAPKMPAAIALFGISPFASEHHTGILLLMPVLLYQRSIVMMTGNV